MSPFTLRLDPATHARLKRLSVALDRSMNDIAVQALEGFLQVTAEAEAADLERRAERIRFAASADPGWENAIAGVARAEMAHSDPLEGVVEPTPADPRRVALSKILHRG
jgi:predicted transcriptional regulator